VRRATEQRSLPVLCSGKDNELECSPKSTLQGRVPLNHRPFCPTNSFRGKFTTQPDAGISNLHIISFVLSTHEKQLLYSETVGSPVRLY